MLIATSVLFLGLAMILSIFLKKSILRPVLDLHQGVQKITRNTFKTPAVPHSGDEIEQVAKQFNLLAQELNNYYQTLEYKVHQRTEMLVRTKKLANVGQLAAGIAHEINNPLASIVSCSEGLMERIEEGDYHPEDFQEYLNIVWEEAQRCKEITRSLLDYSRHTDSLPEEQVDIHSLINKNINILKILSLRKKKDNVDFHLELRAEGAEIYGHKDQLSQVFFNLIKNALDSISNEGKISFRTYLKDEKLWVEIEDNGCGISPEKLSQVWEPFYTTKEPGQGTGLGLSVCLGVLEDHEATIQIESPGVGKGTNIIMSFNLARSATEAVS